MAQLSVVVPAAPRIAPPALDLARAAGSAAFAGVIALAAVAAVLAVGPRFLPYQVLPVLSGSMEPAIPTGSLAVVVTVRAEELAVGDVITFHHPQAARTYVTHRIVRIEGTGADRTFITRGDANALEDPWQVKASGSGWRYAFGVPFIGMLIIAFAASPLRTALFAVPIVALGVMALLDIWRPQRRDIPADGLAQAA